MSVAAPVHACAQKCTYRFAGWVPGGSTGTGTGIGTGTGTDTDTSAASPGAGLAIFSAGGDHFEALIEARWSEGCTSGVVSPSIEE